MTSFCHRLLQRLAFSKLHHFNRNKDPVNTNHNKGKRGETTSLSDKATKMTKSKKQQQTVDTREPYRRPKRGHLKRASRNRTAKARTTKLYAGANKPNPMTKYWLVGGRRQRQRWLTSRQWWGALRTKGWGKKKPKEANQTPKKLVTFVEAASTPATQEPATKVTYNKCVVPFAIRVGKGNDT